MNKIMLADVIEDAADNWLWNGIEAYSGGDQRIYSCNALVEAIREAVGDSGRAGQQLWDLLDAVELPLISAFDDFEYGEEQQSVRYAWLDQLARYAREEGIEVEA